jgi:NitT/TauT family transport system substrate-binding protein
MGMGRAAAGERADSTRPRLIRTLSAPSPHPVRASPAAARPPARRLRRKLRRLFTAPANVRATCTAPRHKKSRSINTGFDPGGAAPHPRPQSLTRRRELSSMTKFVTTSALALAAALGAACGAAAADTVRFGTNWVAQAEHGGYYQAIVDGTFEACGLSVEIVPGGPQVNNRALMMAGKIDFFMGGNLLQPYSAVKEGIPFVVVAAHFQKEPQVILTHPGKAEVFADVAKLGTLFIGENGFQSYYQYLMFEHGFKAENRAPYTYNAAPFIADMNSGQQGYVTSEPFAIEREGGFKPDIWLLADYGFSTYATTVETMQATVGAKPEQVKCFVEASSIGWANYLYGDPTAANAMIKADNPGMSDEQMAFSRDKLIEYGIVDSGDALDLGIGGMTDATFTDFYAKMVKAGVLPEGLDISKSYTLAFSNSGVALPVKKKLLGQ